MKVMCAALVTVCAVLAVEKKVKLEELPAAVQAAVKEQMRNALLVGLSTEKEKGETTHEVVEIDSKAAKVVRRCSTRSLRVPTRTLV